MINQKRLYDLEYWVGNKKVETIFYQKPIQLCKWKENQLKSQHNYKLGKFKIV